MKLIVGLGNPGARYETTRHNVGFLAIDRLVDAWGASGGGKKFEAEVYSCSVGGEKIVLAKPQTFMNLSGRSVGPMLSFYKIEPSDLIVIHDELDLPPMSLRIKRGGGAGGHNGIKSIDEHLGSQDYYRVRIGIGKPERGNGADYVLDQYSDQELNELDPKLDDVKNICEMLLRGEMTCAMNLYHKRETEIKE